MTRWHLAVRLRRCGQTPDLLLPGEIRGNEAGAILALVLSDHPVISTLHARSCQEAIERFASCAALPAPMYEGGARMDCGRLRAASMCLIKVDFWEESGRRLVTEIALLDGAKSSTASLKPRVIPLVKVDVMPRQDCVDWEARVVQGGMLEWTAGADRTPEALREKLRRARALAQVRATNHAGCGG